MRLNLYDACDIVAEDAVELLMEHEGEDKLSKAVGQCSPDAVIRAVLEGTAADRTDRIPNGSADGRTGYGKEDYTKYSKKARKKNTVKRSRKVYFLAAVLIVAAYSSVSLAVRKRDVRNNYGAEPVNETNRDLVGKELSAKVAAVYDAQGNWVNEAEYKAAYGEPDPDQFNWKTCSLIRGVDPAACVPRTIDEFTVQENGLNSLQFAGLPVNRNTYTTPEVIFSNGAMVIFVKEDGNGWHLKKGETLRFEVEEYPSEINLGRGQHVIFQSIFNGTLMRDESLETKDNGLEQSCELTAEKTGEYYICLIGASSDPITIKEGSLTVR